MAGIVPQWGTRDRLCPVAAGWVLGAAGEVPKRKKPPGPKGRRGAMLEYTEFVLAGLLWLPRLKLMVAH